MFTMKYFNYHCEYSSFIREIINPKLFAANGSWDWKCILYIKGVCTEFTNDTFAIEIAV